MADVFTRKKRSEVMSRIKGQDTKLEIKIRSRLFKDGFRFRKNDKRYPGKPDVILPKYKTAIFINGCFWHGHKDKNCKLARIPKSNVDFWENKIMTNRERDRKNCARLVQLEWAVIVVWECELSNFDRLNEIYSEIT